MNVEMKLVKKKYSYGLVMVRNLRVYLLVSEPRDGHKAKVNMTGGVFLLTTRISIVPINRDFSMNIDS